MTGKNSTCFNYLHTLHGDDKTIPGSLTVSHTEEPGAQLGSRLHNPALMSLTHCPSQEADVRKAFSSHTKESDRYFRNINWLKSKKIF